MRRILTAIVLTPLIVYVVVWGPQWAFLAVLAAVALLCFHEYSGIVAGYRIERPGPLGYAAGLIILLARNEPTLLVTLAVLLVLAFTLGLEDLGKTLPRAGATALGLIYVFAVWRTAISLRAISPYWLMFALALNWVADTAAYYVGRWCGRHKLAPRISPGKSWEGAIASFAAALVFAVVYLRFLIPSAGPAQALLLGGAGNVAGQIGDLAESALKRGAGVKDSGNMLPGHGGWLDRVDSALFAVPVIYALLAWRGM
jgi:phosphatidate cytidylyltransferase